MGSVILLGISLVLWHYYGFTRGSKAGYLILGFLAVRGTVAVLNGVYDFFPITRDAVQFDLVASWIAEEVAAGRVFLILREMTARTILEPGYTIPLGIVYSIFGAEVGVGFVLNTIVFSLTSFNVYRIARRCFGDRAGLLSLVVFSLLPYTVMHSTYLYRDPVINYFLSEVFFRLLAWKDTTRSKKKLLWLLVVVLVSGILRRENLVILLLVTYCMVFVREMGNLRQSRNPLKLMILIGVFALCFHVWYRAERYPWIFQEVSELVRIEVMQERIEKHLDDAQSSYLVGHRIESGFDIIRYMPIRAIYFYLSPMPWDIFKKEQLIPMCEAWIVLVLTYYFIRSSLVLWNDRELKRFVGIVGIYLCVGICGSSLIQSNSAGAQRHRTQFTFLVVAMGAPLLSRKRFDRAARRKCAERAPVLETSLAG